MNDKIKKLLKGAGYSDEVISSTEKEEFDAQKAVEENNSALKEHYKSLLENQIKEEVKDEITQQSEGKIYKMVNHELKKLGVPMEKVEDAALFGKLKIASEHFKSQAEQASGKVNEDFKALQEENLNLKNQLSEKEDWLPKSEIENERQKLLAERKSEKMDLHLQKKFTAIPSSKILGGEHNDGFFTGIKAFIEKNYDTDFDKDEVVFLEKGKTTRATMKVDGKEVWKKTDDVVVEALKTYKWWVESNGQGGQGQQDQTGGGNGGGQQKPKSERLIQLEKKIEAEQRA